MVMDMVDAVTPMWRARSKRAGGFVVVQVVEDAGLIGAEDGVGGFVADMAFVAGEVDLGVAAEDRFRPRGSCSGSIYKLIGQIKLKTGKKQGGSPALPRPRMRVGREAYPTTTALPGS